MYTARVSISSTTASIFYKHSHLTSFCRSLVALLTVIISSRAGQVECIQWPVDHLHFHWTIVLDEALKELEIAQGVATHKFVHRTRFKCEFTSRGIIG